MAQSLQHVARSDARDTKAVQQVSVYFDTVPVVHRVADGFELNDPLTAVNIDLVSRA